ncbi:MAG: DUF3179 domain-containing protein [Fimbriimonadaceae bacterium]|nr:DUF3179 domain-containing protein [Chitinophagales bacterium]
MGNFILYLTGFLILIIPEILRVYWIMPFPGSQQDEMVGAAYFVNRYIWIFRIIGLLIIAAPVYYYVIKSKWVKKIAAILPLLLYAAVFYFTNYIARADKMFRQPEAKIFADVNTNKIPVYNQIIGIEIHGEAKAYPVELIGYHHQVEDTVGGVPVMVTYCTVCRTGRVFDPVINNKKEEFRLVGMDYFNAMFEDATTKSWWRQATGECVAGKLKGDFLNEIPSQQMSLISWMEKYPGTKIMQPDPVFAEQYSYLIEYDEGTLSDPLERTDWNSWQLKSWVIGVKTNEGEKAYDWNDLQKEIVINDTIKNTPVLILMEDDTISFHTYNRMIDTLCLEFIYDSSTTTLKDINTNSTWNYYGKCTAGILEGKQLKPVQSYQEFWHSWKTFHPNTTVYKGSK